MSEGVFQTDREIFSNPIWKNVLKFRLFFYMYGNAVYMEAGKDYGSIHVNRGQILKSYRKLQEALEYIENHAVKQYSLSQIKRAVDELEQEGRITKSETELGTLFTICNYEQYQGFGRFATDSIEQRKNTERTLKEHCWNNKKKDNNDKKEKKDIYSDSISDFTSDSDLIRTVDDFIDMRKKIRKPLTERGLQLMLKRLAKLSTDKDTQIRILEQSIMNNWQGVFPLKEERTEERKTEIEEWVNS